MGFFLCSSEFKLGNSTIVALRGYVSVILLRGCIVGVAGENLDSTKGHASHHHVCAERVPQPMKVTADAREL